MERPVHRVVDLVDPTTQRLVGLTPEEARDRLLAADRGGEGEVDAIRGSWALVARDGERVVMARSLDRPLRYFLAKAAAGPLLVVAERIDAIRDELERRGHGDQFHPSYTRMVPAHHVLTLRLVGCPDPNPTCRRWFSPPRGTGPADPEALGRRYVGALHGAIAGWLAAQPADEPLGVAFSGGIDSGAVLLCLYRALLDAGQSPSRLKAFTLAVDGGGDDLAQARSFLAAVGLELLGEAVEVEAGAVDPLEAVELIEDYKPLDVECAAMVLALLRGVRRRYPGWRLVLDGDGGDENLKSYPIEDNPELTIRSVVSNPLLYQEGWGVEAIKHSLTYSGGYSRSCVRTWGPARRLGFLPFSPFTDPAVVAAAEAIPFAELAAGRPEALYALKGDLVARGVKAVTGFDLPAFPKRRFQHGAGPGGWFAERFGGPPSRYRQHFLAVYGGVR
jgi:asparagine synthase (glutamine-hydrolysing)